MTPKPKLSATTGARGARRVLVQFAGEFKLVRAVYEQRKRTRREVVRAAMRAAYEQRADEPEGSYRHLARSSILMRLLSAVIIIIGGDLQISDQPNRRASVKKNLEELDPRDQTQVIYGILGRAYVAF